MSCFRSSFATAQSSAYDVDKEVERIIKEFKAQSKPMGYASCLVFVK